MKIKSVVNIAVSLGVMMLIFSACNPDTQLAGYSEYARIYMPQAVEQPAKYSLIMTDSVQTIIYGADYSGPNYPKSKIQVHFSVDSSLVDSFNVANGTNYKMMPAAGYKLVQKTAVIPAGQVQTKPLNLKITTIGALQPHINYLLPLSVETNHNIQINKKLQTTYFLINAHFKFFDRSNWTVLSVDSYQKHPPFPGSNAIDGNPNTFWHTRYTRPQPPLPHDIIIDMDTTHTVHGFKIIGRLGRFNARGNPVDIVIQVSNATTNWGQGQHFTLPFNKKVRNTKVYLSPSMKGRYFKLTVTSTFENTKFTHIAEIYAF